MERPWLVGAQKKATQVAAKLAVERAKARYEADPVFCQRCDKKIELPDGVNPCEIRRRKFCGHTCSARQSNANRFEPWKCKRCGKTEGRLTKGSKLCGACQTEFRSDRTILRSTMTAGEARLRYAKHGKANSNTLIRMRARTTLLRRGACKCMFCGYSHHVEVAHIRAVAGFHNSAMIAEINHIENLLALCPNCHWEFDHGMLSIELIKKSCHYIMGPPGLAPGTSSL